VRCDQVQSWQACLIQSLREHACGTDESAEPDDAMDRGAIRVPWPDVACLTPTSVSFLPPFLSFLRWTFLIQHSAAGSLGHKEGKNLSRTLRTFFKNCTSSVMLITSSFVLVGVVCLGYWCSAELLTRAATTQRLPKP
jgi:hypothetical protein